MGVAGAEVSLCAVVLNFQQAYTSYEVKWLICYDTS